MHDPQRKNVYDVHDPITACAEYSTTEVTLPSCLSVPSEHVASQSKWQSADLDLLKLAKKCVASAIPR